MTRDDPSERLISLVQRVPLLAIDEQLAQLQGDDEQLAYAQAVRAWRAEAATTIAEVRQSNATCARHAAPDAFDRIAEASALMRSPAAD